MKKFLTFGHPFLFLQFDCDGLWAVRQWYQSPEEDSFEHDWLFSEGIEESLALFSSFGIPAAYFIMGRDLTIPEKVSCLSEVLSRGHQLANHSYSHPLGFSRLSPEQQTKEIETTQRLAQEHLNTRLLGFRAPGYSFSSSLLPLLQSCQLHYDSSLLPTPWVFVLRRLAGLVQGNPFAQRTHFPSSRYGFASRRPYSLSNNEHTIYEFPVTVSRGLRLPLSFSYMLKWGYAAIRRNLLYLARHSLPLILVLHPVDMVELHARPFLPGSHWRRVMGASKGSKQELLKKVLSLALELFSPSTIESFLENPTRYLKE